MDPKWIIYVCKHIKRQKKIRKTLVSRDNKVSASHLNDDTYGMIHELDVCKR